MTVTKDNKSKHWDDEDYKSFQALLKRMSNLEVSFSKLLQELYK